MYDNADQNDAGAGTYVYDGQGQRIQRTAVTSTGTETTTYVYDAFGKLAAEYSTKASSEPAALRLFRTSDHLGSTRLVTDAAGQTRPNGCRDFLPFGERIDKDVGGRTDGCYDDVPGAADGFAQKFTAKERDDESNLDYFGARYFSASLGRFTGPDVPLLDQSPANPQSWNLYGYVRNNPLVYTDPTGQFCWFGRLGNTCEEEAREQAAMEIPLEPLPQPLPGTTPPPGPAPAVTNPNPSFETVDEAGIAGAQAANEPTKREGVEYGGLLFKYPGESGRHSYTPFVTDNDQGTVDTRNVRIPPGAVVAGEVHTHPGTQPGSEPYGFSTSDANNARLRGGPTFVATPNGAIMVYQHAPRRNEFVVGSPPPYRSIIPSRQRNRSR